MYNMRRLIVLISMLLVLAGWTVLVGAGVLDGWGRKPLAPKDDADLFSRAVAERIEKQSRGNAVFALIKAGRVIDEHYRSIGRPVDGDTLFQVASLSKWITAWGAMTLVESGRLDLDAPVSRYLTRWTLPPSEFDNDGVTVRRLLSHTAGLTDGLGYAGFAPGVTIQTLEESLTQAADASPGASGAVRVGAAPGSDWRYSGGGYTLLQLIIEEVSGEPFNDYMRRAVFEPLDMSRSTFDTPVGEGSNVAEFYDDSGSIATHFQFTAKAAASLYTSVTDLSRFIAAQIAGPGGEPAGRGVLAPATIADMRRPHGYRYGVEVWGLGVVLYAPNRAGDFIVGHDGSNEPAINTTARVDPATGDGFILLETGNDRLATDLAGDWVFWKTGHVDLFDVIAALPKALPILGAGYVIIIIAGFASLRSGARW